MAVGWVVRLATLIPDDFWALFFCFCPTWWRMIEAPSGDVTRNMRRWAECLVPDSLLMKLLTFTVCTGNPLEVRRWMPQCEVQFPAS